MKLLEITANNLYQDAEEFYREEYTHVLWQGKIYLATTSGEHDSPIELIDEVPVSLA